MKRRLKKLSKSQIITIISITIFVILVGIITNYAEKETEYLKHENYYETLEEECKELKKENKKLREEKSLYIKLLKINNDINTN